MNIGDVTVTCWDCRRNYLRRYTGRLVIYRGVNETLIKIEYESDANVGIPCNQIVAYSIVHTKIVLQLKEYFFFNRCTLQLYNQEQIDRVINLIPPIIRPNHDPYNDDVTSSDTDLHASGAGKTEGVDNSFDSDNPSSKHDE